VAIAARAVYARALLSAFRRRGAAASDGPLCQRADRLARRLGIRRQVCMLEAPGLAAPVAFGSLRPVVALPVGFADELDARQQDAVLAHELAHLAAGDPAWQSVADLLCAALWWHPLAWWSRRRLRAASEAAADEASLIVPDGPGLLAGCLVALGRRLAEPAGAGWLSFGGSGFRSGLGRRVERLLDLRNRPWRAPGRGRMLLARTLVPVALVFQAISCTAWARPQVTLTEGGTTMSILTTSWQHSLAAAMLGWIAAGSAPAVSEAQPVENPAPAVVAAAPSDVQGQGPMAVQADQDSARQSAERQLQEAIQRALEAGQNQTGQFQAQIEEIERQSQQSQDDRFAGAIQELKRLADAVADELHAVEQDPAELEAHLQALIQLRDNLAKRAADLERRLAGMRQDDRVRQMQDLLARAHELAAGAETRVRRLAQRINAQPGQPEGPLPPNPDIEYLSRLLESQAAALRAAGRFDEAEAMQQEARDFFERAQPRPEPPPGSPEDFERRIHHVEVAIENLHAAGLHDQAERLVPQLDRLRIEREAAGRRRAAPVLRSSLPPVPPVQPTPPEMGQPVQQQQQRAIRELGAQVGQLRDEMAQLRQMLQELLQRDGPR
jgi:tetratricopeptide (TPR) repeat protein